MSDIIDNANQQNEVWLESHIAAQRAHKNEPVHVIGNTHYCIDCNEPINPERVAKMPSASRCVDCQSAIEKKEKHFV
ncbi:TraR/DksA C4-type zinc finger protein [Psychromonas sp. MME2]|uniref:TraR/DksA C4-type zinc finger protein n=1 Tax=unclassified Psychromonas TaxID=2614957 RepID=UPI00339CDADF